MKNDVAQEVWKATPPASVTAWAWINGLTLDKWVAIATLVYIALQAAHLLWKWYRDWRRK